MARNDDGMYHNFRLSRRNPIHIRINEILSDLNKDVYRSKNQFIADALEYYINALENDTMTNSENIKKQKMNTYVTKGELELLKENIKNEVVKEVQKEMISVLGNFSGNMAKGIVADNLETIDKDNDDLNENTTLLGLAEMWGE